VRRRAVLRPCWAGEEAEGAEGVAGVEEDGAGGDAAGVAGGGTDGEEGGDARVFRCTDYSLPRTTLALALWLGGIHFNVLLVLASLFLLSLRAAAIVVAVQLFFMFVPVNDRDKWGRSIARYPCFSSFLPFLMVGIRFSLLHGC